VEASGRLRDQRRVRTRRTARIATPTATLTRARRSIDKNEKAIIQHSQKLSSRMSEDGSMLEADSVISDLMRNANFVSSTHHQME
jgi:hypothetical protein